MSGQNQPQFQDTACAEAVKEIATLTQTAREALEHLVDTIPGMSREQFQFEDRS